MNPEKSALDFPRTGSAAATPTAVTPGPYQDRAGHTKSLQTFSISEAGPAAREEGRLEPEG